jgi:HAD superfamily hydrolase (TIGR01549 family)
MKAIFYDMDGTLIHFKIDFKLARRKAIDIMENHGIPKGRYNVDSSILSSVDDAKIFLKEQMKFDEVKVKSIMLEVHDAIVKVEADAAKQATPVSGIKDVLKYCKSKGYLQIVITFNTHTNAELSLKNAGISEYIDDIFGRDDVIKPKPNLNHIKTAADKYSIKNNECIMIGDHSIDINAAKAFGCKSIGIQRKGSLNEIQGANYTINQNDIPNKIIEILKTLS